MPNRGEKNRIVGGTLANDHQYPWQVLLYMKWNRSRATCSGSLIHPQWVLTAYHCMHRLKNGEMWLPIVSVHLGMDTRDDEGVVRTAIDIIMHDKLDMRYDIALLKLDSPVPFSSTILPICLPPRSLLDESPEGVHLEIAGWGKDELGKKSNVLKVIERIGMSPKKCWVWYPKYITDHHFCSYSTDGKHICVGDSGGPVMREVEGRLVLYGVSSFTGSETCNNTTPDGHISVTHFLDWIADKTGIEVPE
ncbi:Plasma kallikrein [Chionoecetes opilio]|uniref:Plasma kallikrein n=1 Tax=Chionoecetes opilio TaxID=41210 RepID=A0A8J4XXS1_CHIOP|nr:Plasma kallikrein [Chionoecetes opilio]